MNFGSRSEQPAGLRIKPLAAAVSILMLGLATPSLAEAQSAVSTKVAVQNYQISAGTLEQALNQFGQQAGVLLSFDPQLVADRQSNGLSGQHSFEQASQLLLAGSGLVIVAAPDGGFMLAAEAAAQTLNDVEIIARQFAAGDEAVGYRVNSVDQLGALGGRSLEDTPYSVHSLTTALFNNIQAGTPSDAQRLNPFVQLNQRQSSGFSNFVNIRGFEGDAWAQKFEDGMRASSLGTVAMEDKERMEIINGATGFLYGMGSPGGAVNYVLKRPTDEPLRQLRLGNYGGESYYAHADLSDSITEDGRLAYRLNLMGQNGDTEVDDQSEERALISGALDYQVNDDLLLRFDASHNAYRIEGTSTIWQFVGVPHPSALDTSTQWGQKWSYSDIETSKLGTSMQWQLTDNIGLRAGASHSITDRDYILSANAVTPLTAGGFAPAVLAVAPQEHFNTAGYLYTDIDLVIGGLDHRFTLGGAFDRNRTEQHQDNTVIQYLPGLGTFNQPAHLPALTLNDLNIGNQQRITTNSASNKTLTIADTVTFNDQWEAIAGVTWADITSTTFANPFNGTQFTQSSDTDLTPALSLIYKPQPDVTTWASYIEGLEAGGVAPVYAANAGEVMPVQVSKQYELGVRATLGGLMLTGALFDIERANEFVDPLDNNFKQSGTQHNRGIELGATGKLTDNLTVITGFTLLDAEVEEEGNNDPVAVTEKLAKLYVEYQATPLLRGLTLTGGVFYTGEAAVDAANTEFLPSYTLMDIGARYAFDAGDTPIQLSVNLKNLTDEDYWVNSRYLGDPRTLTFAASARF